MTPDVDDCAHAVSDTNSAAAQSDSIRDHLLTMTRPPGSEKWPPTKCSRDRCNLNPENPKAKIPQPKGLRRNEPPVPPFGSQNLKAASMPVKRSFRTAANYIYFQ
jgi:hypothetical protein